MLDEHKDKIEGSEKADIEAAIAAVEKVKDGEDVAAIEAAVAELEKVSMTFGKRVYAAQQQAGPEAAQAAQAAAGGGAGPGPQPGKGGGEDIKDADFTVHK